MKFNAFFCLPAFNPVYGFFLGQFVCALQLPFGGVAGGAWL